MRLLFSILLLLCALAGAAQPKIGQARLDSLLEELPRQIEAKDKIELLDHISFIYSEINPNEGLNYATQMLTLAKKHQRRLDEGKAYRTLGINYYEKAELGKAEKNLSNAMVIAEELNNKALKESVYRWLSYTYSLGNDLPKSNEYRLKAEALFVPTDDYEKALIKLFKQISQYDLQKNNEGVLSSYREIIKVNELQGNITSIARRTLSIAYRYSLMGNFRNLWLTALKRSPLPRK